MTEQGANGGRPEPAGSTDESRPSTAPDPASPSSSSSSASGESGESGADPSHSGSAPDSTPDSTAGSRAASNGRAEAAQTSPPVTSTTSAPATIAKRNEAERKASRGERLRTAGSTVKKGTDALRNRIASVVWVVAVLCAVVLALGALLISLDANPDNALVEFVTDAAKRLDGPFANVFEFDGEDARTKTRLVNWGLAALAYLIVGRVADRIIRA